MANNITYTTLVPTNGFVGPSSRYADSTILYYGPNSVLTFTTYVRKSAYVPSSNDKYAVIPPGFEYRPDKMSLSAYGTVDFWWKIMEANNIKDVFDFKSGLSIRLPASVM